MILFILITLGLYLVSIYATNDMGSTHPIIYPSLLFIPLLIMQIYTTVNGCYPDYSSGHRIGSIYKLSDRGVFIKSHEGELISDGGININAWAFSIKSEDVYKKLITIPCKQVKLDYKQYLISPFYIESNYEITDVTCITTE